LKFEQKNFEAKNIPPAAGSLIKSHIITFIYFLVSNLAKNISPSPKGLHFVWEGYIFVWGGVWLKPLQVQAHAWLRPRYKLTAYRPNS